MDGVQERLTLTIYKNGSHVLLKSKRNILEIEEIRWEYVQKRKKLYESKWSQLYKEMSQIKKFWVSTNLEFERIIYTCLPDSFSTDNKTPSTPEWYETVDDKELPILLEEKNLPQDSKGVIEKRLLGEIKKIPQNQELHIRQKKISKRFNLIDKVISLCELVIERLVIQKYNSTTLLNQRNTPQSIILNNREYIYNLGYTSIHSRLIRPPEKEETPYVVPPILLKDFL